MKFKKGDAVTVGGVHNEIVGYEQNNFIVKSKIGSLSEIELWSEGEVEFVFNAGEVKK